MRNYIKYLLILTLMLSSQAMADRAGRAIKGTQDIPGCSKVYPIGSNIYKNSKPHRACSAIHCPIDYFEKFPSLLINQKGLPRPGSATLIDSNGTAIMQCGQLPCRDCRAGYRYVCRGNTNNIAKTTFARTKSYKALYRINNVCVTIPDIGRCIGSVKGLCNKALH